MFLPRKPLLPKFVLVNTPLQSPFLGAMGLCVLLLDVLSFDGFELGFREYDALCCPVPVT